MPEVVLKLYLKVGDQSFKVAKFVQENIKKINRIGAKVKVTLLKDGETAKSYAELRKRGVTDLPALLTSKNVFVGYGQISNYLKQNINKAEHTAVSARVSGDIYEDYVAREMMNKDDEKKEDPGDDFHRRMTEMRTRRGDQSITARQDQQPDQPRDTPRDNIQPPPSVQPQRSGPKTEDDMDREMLAALIGAQDYRDQF